MSTDEGQKYGQALPDQVDRIASLFDAHLGLISDVRELYRDRVALEREYATKLQALAKRAAEKKSRAEATLVVGEEPTKAWDERTLGKSTLNAAYAEIINSMASTAQDHVSVADALTTQVVDILKIVEKRNEESKRKEMQFFQKLLSERDRVYADRVKAKQKYDEECVEVETYRQKQGRAQDDRHAERAAKQADQQRVDMLNSKNVYLISTAIANRAKEKFYIDDLPELENELQALQSRLVNRFVEILLQTQSLQTTHLDSLKKRLSTVENSLQAVNASKDEDLFIEHNIRPFKAPDDWSFEPCATFYDKPEMSIEPGPKVFLQNKLNRSRAKLQELRPVLDSKRGDRDQLLKLITAYTANRPLGDLDDAAERYQDTRQQITSYSTSECIIEVEIDTISDALKGDEGGQQPHSFKSSSFSIPTQCGYCKSSIWGLSKQGKTCKLCGLSVHAKCELKVPADCQHSEGRPSSLSSRKSVLVNEKATRQAPTPSSFVHSAVAEEPAKEPYPTARVIFDYTATSAFELNVKDGQEVTVLEPDDGSGWVKVAEAGGADGLVPASYIEYVDGSEAVPPGNAGTSKAPTQQGSGTYVRGIYPYEAQGPDEIHVKEGQLLELSSGPSGGRNYADGWWEGYDSTGRKGIFPSNYVELV